MSEKTLLPVGTILPYACGNLGFLDDGWLPCDGTPYRRADYPELFAAIGTAYGAPNTQDFNVPDLQGLFVRGCDNGTGRDTRANQRGALRPGGNSGSSVGSYQVYGTAIPKGQPFSAVFSKCDLSEGSDDKGCAASPGRWNDNATAVIPTMGGDLESRCCNIYVNWIIKASTKSPSEGVYTMVPIAAVTAYAGNDPKKVDAGTWLFCDGTSLGNTGLYKELSVRINYAFGAPAPDQPPVKPYCLPDFRGQFLRGVDMGSGRDPDTMTRTAPRPDIPPPGRVGATGDNVGSVQAYATALPHNPLTSTLYHLPDSDGSDRVAGSLWDLAGGYDGATDVPLTTRGGDKETRPRNMAVDWFVARRQPDGVEPDDAVPVGAVVAIGSQGLGDNDNFLLCDGRSISAETYSELYAQIGLLYGGDEQAKRFNLPNYQGVFLRGADHGANRDPDAASRTFYSTANPPPAVGTAGSYQDYGTGRPATQPFVATVPHMPTNTHGAHGYTNSGQCRVNGDLSADTCTSGGDGDSAPANVYAQYFIKVRS